MVELSARSMSKMLNVTVTVFTIAILVSIRSTLSMTMAPCQEVLTSRSPIVYSLLNGVLLESLDHRLLRALIPLGGVQLVLLIATYKRQGFGVRPR